MRIIMRVNKYRFILFTLLALFSNGVARSQQQSDSLVHYLGMAAKNNPSVLQKWNEYQAALQKVPQVGSLPDPELSLGVFLSPMELQGGNQVADIQLMQMFPWFGVLKNAKDEMSLMAKARFESFRETKLQVFYDLQRTWYELQKVQQNVRISEKNMEILRTLERLSLIKFKAASPTGGSGLADLYRIQIEIGALENNIALLKSQQTTVAARFNAYLNRPAKSPVSLPEMLVPDTLRIPLKAVPDSMLANSPMLSMLQYEQKSLESRKKMVTAMGYPMIGLGLKYSLINKSEMSTSPMNGKDMIMPMVTVTLPVYRKKYRAMQAEAGLMKTATEQNYLATANSLQTEYFEAMQLYQDSQRRIKLFEDQSKLAGKSLEIMIKSFSASGSGLTDVLLIRQQMLDYEFSRIEAVVDFNISIAWLEKLMANSQIR